MTDYKIINQDILKFCKEYDGPKFHALFSDPPYHLTSITKRLGKEGSAPAKYGKDGAFQRAATGFMGKGWDGGDIAFRPETWKSLGELLYPGAFGMAFAGSRGYHRMGVAIENAGFIIHPVLGWVFGSGFPKATRIDTQIDKAAGIERKKIGTIRRWGNAAGKGRGGQYANAHEESIVGAERFDDITIPTTELAQAWEGHRYGLQALKPALEMICVFQKPYEGRPVDNIVETGAGALNIEKGRIGVDPGGIDDPRLGGEGKWKTGKAGYGIKWDREDISSSSKGRWPANFALSHSPECELIGYRDSDSYVINRFTDGAKPFGDGAGHEYETEIIEAGDVPVYECVEGCAVRTLDQQTRILKSGRLEKHHKISTEFGYHGGKRSEETQAPIYGDSGGPTRFFYNADWMHERLEKSDPMKYQAKAGRTERDAGLTTEKEEVPYSKYRENFKATKDFVTHYPDGSPRPVNKLRNAHPAIKPIALTRWLASLLLPPGHYSPRRLLVPFSGVGSEMIGAFQAGWDDITGVELEEEYVEIAKTRIEYWLKQGVQLDMFGKS